VFARVKFWDRRQRDGESNEEFIRAIYKLGESCAYGDGLHQHIRDKLGNGMLDRKMAAELRSNSQLRLEDVLKKLRCKEAMSKDIQEEKNRVRETLRLVQAEVKREPGDVDVVQQRMTG
jgi:hypothetical protein